MIYIRLKCQLRLCQVGGETKNAFIMETKNITDTELRDPT
jgi:hypothetical protein